MPKKVPALNKLTLLLNRLELFIAVFRSMILYVLFNSASKTNILKFS